MADVNRDALSAALGALNVDAGEQGVLLTALDAMTSRVPEGTTFTVRTVTPSLPAGAAPHDPVALSAVGPNEATIVDVRSASHANIRLTAGYAALLGHTHVYADDGDNVIAGDAADQEVSAGLGNDIVFGGGNSDTIRGNEGIDLVYGNQGFDIIYGNQGNDTMFGGQGTDTLYAGKDDDLVYSNLGDDLAYGNLGNDTMFGGQGNDTMFGGQGDDALLGNLGDDRMLGNAGNDTLTGGPGADIFVFGSGSGADTITDMNVSDGDRISLATGLTYTVVSDTSGNAVLSLSSGDTVTLTGITASAVNTGWFVTA